MPVSGTSAHAFTLLHDSEEAAFRAQVAALGAGTTLLVDTYDIHTGVETAVRVAGPGLGAVRIDSGDLAVLAVQVRAQLDALGATGTRVVLSGDLDEFGLAALAAAPVDAYGVGTSVVQGSGAPTAGMVYKLVEVEGRPVAKRSESKQTHGGRKTAVRRHRRSGTATEEVVSAAGAPVAEAGDRVLQVPLVRSGQRVGGPSSGAALAAAREHLQQVLVTMPWEGLALSRGEPADPDDRGAAGLSPRWASSAERRQWWLLRPIASACGRPSRMRATRSAWRRWEAMTAEPSRPTAMNRMPPNLAALCQVLIPPSSRPTNSIREPRPTRKEETTTG